MTVKFIPTVATSTDDDDREQDDLGPADVVQALAQLGHDGADRGRPGDPGRRPELLLVHHQQARRSRPGSWRR